MKRDEIAHPREARTENPMKPRIVDEALAAYIVIGGSTLALDLLEFTRGYAAMETVLATRDAPTHPFISHERAIA